MILNKNIKAFIVHITPFNLNFILIYLACKFKTVLLFTKKLLF